MGWGDLNNGALLDAMADEFDALVTVDKRLPQRQQIKDRPFAVVVLVPRAEASRRWTETRPSGESHIDIVGEVARVGSIIP